DPGAGCPPGFGRLHGPPLEARAPLGSGGLLGLAKLVILKLFNICSLSRRVKGVDTSPKPGEVALPDSARSRSLTIGALSRATGIPPATLRTWERRYDFPRSSRKPSGHRLYSTEEVPNLLRIKSALAL